MKKFTEKQPPQSAPAFDVQWKPFFLNIESPETSDVRIVVSYRAHDISDLDEEAAFVT